MSDNNCKDKKVEHEEDVSMDDPKAGCSYQNVDSKDEEPRGEPEKPSKPKMTWLSYQKTIQERYQAILQMKQEMIEFNNEYAVTESNLMRERQKRIKELKQMPRTKERSAEIEKLQKEQTDSQHQIEIYCIRNEMIEEEKRMLKGLADL